MRLSRVGMSVVIAMLALCATPVTLARGIRVDVVGGKHAVTDWVAEATLDLAAAAKLLGVEGRPDRIAVSELQASGTRTIPVPNQVDRAGNTGLYIIAWRVPGRIEAGASRTFVIRFGVSGETVDEAHPIRVHGNKDTATVTNSNAITGDSIVLQHHRAGGGMISSVCVGGAAAKSLRWNDRLHDGKSYYFANHDADRMDIVAGGPLRATIETQSEFLLTRSVVTKSGPMAVAGAAAGKSAASRPRATYRFTSYAGLPFTVVEALITQDFAHQWPNMIFIELQLTDAGFTHYRTDTINMGDRAAGGEMQKTGKAYDGREWAAVYDDDVLMATCASVSPFVYDGDGGYYVSYLTSGRMPMTGLRHPWRAALIWGAGPQAIEDETVQRWSRILADPPKVHIAFAALQERLNRAEQAFGKKEDALAALSGEPWAAGHVSVTVGRVQAAIARQKLSSGSFGEALDALAVCEQSLAAGAGDVDLVTGGTIQAGTVQGYPCLGNDRAVFLWAKPQDGAGLISIFDRESRRELLKVDAKEAPLWQISAKLNAGGKGYQNTGVPCHVEAGVGEKEGRLRFRWSEGVAVDVQARLEAGTSLLRLRLRAETHGRSGLQTVTFPVIRDIMPLTPRAQRDKVLETWGLGWEVPSPLVSGRASYGRSPAGMQFAAVHGDRLGLYVAEEDGRVNRKELTWTPDSDSQTLDFAIAHPVLNWGAETFVVEYESPGDIVIGPFHGDWYDAARIYRKWALTAPWCSKGPIHEREDYPKWLLTAPYWSIEGLRTEKDIRRIKAIHEHYGFPVTVNHTTLWWFAALQDDREPEYFPPQLGSQGFKRTVRALHEQGVRIVCSVSGWMCDQDTEYFQTQDVANSGAIMGPTGEIRTSNHHGTVMVGMCPATTLWRRTLLDVSKSLIGDYGVAGMYYDFLTFNVNDCYNKDHGHAICGGDYWAGSVHEFYELMRTECRKLNPDAMFTGEGVAEFCIDVLDTFLCGGQSKGTPLFPAVYHGYANVYGGEVNKVKAPVLVGRGWLWGRQNGWHGMEHHLIGTPLGDYYKKLLECRWEFGTPYLGYGEMLRLPRVEGALPVITAEGGQGPFTVPAVEGSAWKAPDGTIGVFLLNFDDKPHSFTWAIDLAETGIDASQRLALSRWTPEGGLTPVKEMNGGAVQEAISIEPWGIIALKLEVRP